MQIGSYSGWKPRKFSAVNIKGSSESKGKGLRFNDSTNSGLVTTKGIAVPSSLIWNG